ncbi:TrmB family transcriptional regulator [Vallitalea sp.]|uniref:TrmB family transcriptional regulator n=1 Tax=Vallitalea sp. TaxID=1882829 RepID=UPI0025EA5A92|nr:helix-turn-helix domain-containing protein [Vallitalea sp.]MCT4686876.1 hypothetical protein [Vallitalea sp.]
MLIINSKCSYSNDEVINCFNELGLSKYEGKVYLALLRNNLSYGSEIQKLSGVPGPKVYETINSLIDKGLVYPSGDRPIRYQPLPLEDFVNINNKRHNNINNYLLKYKDVISENKYPNWLWQMQNYDNIMDKAKEFINEAKEKIIISFWYEDGLIVKDQLEDASKRNVEIISNQMNNQIIELGKVYKHAPLGIAEDIHSSEFILVVDNIYGVFVFENQENKREGYYTYNKGVIRILNNYILHDIYMNKMLSDFGEEIFIKYGNDLGGLLKL